MEDCVNDENEDSTRKYLVEKNDTKVTDEVIEISIETENEDVIHRYITDNEAEKKLSIYKQVIDEFPDDTSTAIIEYCVNNNLNDVNIKYLNEINIIGLDEEEEQPETLKINM